MALFHCLSNHCTVFFCHFDSFAIILCIYVLYVRAYRTTCSRDVVLTGNQPMTTEHGRPTSGRYRTLWCERQERDSTARGVTARRGRGHGLVRKGM